jgi:hypothetical protein
MKGQKTDFMRFNTGTGQWDILSSVPIMARPKIDRGSWLAYDGLDRIYAHKAKVHELWVYHVAADSWGAQLSAMPFTRYTPGKSKKAKDGSSAAWHDGGIYTLKGGNTVEFWRYHTDGDTWTGLDSMPSFGSTAKKRRVKEGADIAATGGDRFYALKGKNTRELWRYQDPWTFGAAPKPAPGGVAAAPTFAAVPSLSASIAPNPAMGGLTRLFYSLPVGGRARVTVLDVTGRIRQKYEFAANRNGAVQLNVAGLAAGVYPVRLEAGGAAATVKLILK